MLSAGPQPQRYRRQARGGRAMRASTKRRGPGPSHVLLTPDHAGNVVGIDPHKRTLTAAVVDARGGIVASEHFRVSGDGHRALEAWARHSDRSRAGGSRTRPAGAGTRGGVPGPPRPGCARRVPEPHATV